MRAQLEVGEPIGLVVSLSPGEREMLLAGGLLELIRRGGLEPAAGRASPGSVLRPT